MKFLNDSYTKVLVHKEFDICTLREVISSKGDKLGYVINHEHFHGKEYNHPDDAIKAIDYHQLMIEYGDLESYLVALNRNKIQVSPELLKRYEYLESMYLECARDLLEDIDEIET